MSGRNTGREIVVGCLNLAASAWGTNPRLLGRERILLIRPDHLGDVVLATAVLRAMRKSRPSAEITILVGPWAAQILRTSNDVDRILTYSFPWFDRQAVPPVFERYFLAVRLAGRLRAYSFDRAVVLRPDHWWGALVARLAGIPQRIGYAGAIQSRLLTDVIPPGGPEHAVVSGLRLVEPCRVLNPQFQQGLPLTSMPITHSDRAIARRILASSFSEKPTRIAMVHPGASVALKRWPVERWATIADRLVVDGWSVAVAAGPGEGALAQDISRTADTTIANLGEIGSIGVLAGLFEGATVALGMDSAPMHVATAVGTPTIRLFGPGNEVFFGPWGDARYHRVVRASGTTPDNDWFGRTGTTHPSVEAITIDMVWQEFHALTVRGG